MSGDPVRFGASGSVRGKTNLDLNRDQASVSGNNPSASVVISRLGAPLLHAWDASNFLMRLRGVHGKLPLGPTEALIIRPCYAIHTIRMPCPIDVVFLNREGKVLRVETVPPQRIRICSKASVVLEMAAGTAARLSLAPGHVLTASTGEWL